MGKTDNIVGFEQFEYITVSDTNTGWSSGNDNRNYGYIDGLVRGFNIEFQHKETGEITYNSAIYVEENIEDYYRERIAEWGSIGYEPFSMEKAKGYEPTGRAVFRGYAVEKYDVEERDYYVEDINIDRYLEEHGIQIKPLEQIDPHKSISDNSILEPQKVKFTLKELKEAKKEKENFLENIKYHIADHVDAVKEYMENNERDLARTAREQLLNIYNTYEEKLLFMGEEPKVGIYQIKDEFLHRFGFESIANLKRFGVISDDAEINNNLYDLVYVMDADGKNADSIYQKFNMNRPEDFFGHSLSVSDVIVFAKAGQHKSFFVDSYGFKELPGFVFAKEDILIDDVHNCKLFDFWIDDNGPIAYYEGQDLENPTIFRALVVDFDEYFYNFDHKPSRKEVEDAHKNRNRKIEQEYEFVDAVSKNFIEFKGKTEIAFTPIMGMGPKEIEGMVLDYANNLLLENEIDAKITDIAIYGSRSRGMQKPKYEASDLDVVVEYEGNIKEDALFNLLNEEKYMIENIPVDINPINKADISLGEYLQTAESYLHDKTLEMLQKGEDVAIAAGLLDEIGTEYMIFPKEIAKIVEEQLGGYGYSSGMYQGMLVKVDMEYSNDNQIQIHSATKESLLQDAIEYRQEILNEREEAGELWDADPAISELAVLEKYQKSLEEELPQKPKISLQGLKRDFGKKLEEEKDSPSNPSKKKTHDIDDDD